MKERLPQGWKRVVVAVSGWSVVVFGVIAIPAPGPGWLIVFAGLRILSSEFPWAARILRYGQEKYGLWEKWRSQQSEVIKSMISIGFFIVLVCILWVWNVLYLASSFLGMEHEWLRSPLLN